MFQLNTKVSIEKTYKKIRGLSQCHNWKAYGQRGNNCIHEPKCVKCGEYHPTNECSKARKSLVKCALCTNEHTTNFKESPVYKDAIKKTVPRV